MHQYICTDYDSGLQGVELGVSWLVAHRLERVQRAYVSQGGWFHRQKERDVLRAELMFESLSEQKMAGCMNQYTGKQHTETCNNAHSRRARNPLLRDILLLSNKEQHSYEEGKSSLADAYDSFGLEAFCTKAGHGTDHRRRMTQRKELFLAVLSAKEEQMC